MKYTNDYNKVKLIEILSSKIKVLSTDIINKLYNLRIIDTVKILSTSQENATTIIKMSSNISSIFVESNTYIEINNNLYLLYYENNQYYINGLVTVKKNRLYRVTRNIDITEIKLKQLFVSDVTINKDIEHYLYFNPTDNNLDEVNFINDKLHINNAEILDRNTIKIYYNYDNLMINDTLIHSYKIRQSKFYEMKVLLS